MRHVLLILGLSLAACSSGPAPHSGPGDDATTGDDAGDRQDVGRMDADASAADDAARDLATEPDVPPEGCASLDPARCLDDPSCTLNGGCVEREPDEQPYPHALTGLWSGTADGTGDAGLAAGATAVTLSVFQSSARELRGLVVLPQLGVTHRFWGGISGSGELGLRLGPAECPDAGLCDGTFGPIYVTGGVATEEELTFADISIAAPNVDFRTIASLRAAPSDGFKPVNPVQVRQDPLLARWNGDMLAVTPDGTIFELGCAFVLADDAGAYTFRSFECARDDGSAIFDAADSTSIAWAAGVGWFALGPEPDDLLFVGRVDLTDAWQGVIVPRGAAWRAGEPVDPASLAIEDLLGTFKFHGFPVD